jgi:hypothetical protein
VTHLIDICVCVLQGRGCNKAGSRVVGETLLVGVEFVARGAGFVFEGFGDWGDGGFAERTRVRVCRGCGLLCHGFDGVIVLQWK